MDLLQPCTQADFIETQEKQNFRTELGYHIFLDRYALKDKDITINLRPGHIVVMHNDEEFGASKSLVGVVVNVHRDAYGVIECADVDVKGTYHGNVPVGMMDRPLEVTPQETYRRVAKAAAACEKEHEREKWENAFYEELNSGRFVPGGRILAGLGTNGGETPNNCFVIPMPEDSKDDIMRSVNDLITIMSRGGGVGYNLSTLRPRTAPVRSVNGRSSGAVSWGRMFSEGTGVVQQGGSRRGAGMFELKIWHPDIIEFIEAKQVPGKIEYANMSVGVTAQFMKAVELDLPWSLRFPVTSDSHYRSEWDGSIERWEAKGYPVTVYQTMRARDLWNRLCESAWKCAEPGVWFCDRAQEMSNSAYYRQGEIIATNPCGEQNLPAWAVCNLGHVNLSKFVLPLEAGSDNIPFNFEQLGVTVSIAVRFLDNVISVGEFPLPQTQEQQHKERRIGLGTLGLAEALMEMQITYGDNPRCLKVVDKIFSYIARKAYLASAVLAHEKGQFHYYDTAILDRPFIKSLDPHIQNKIREMGLRNVCLLSQAPTGTIGTMMGTSTGIEPFFGFNWTRVGRMGRYSEVMPLIARWQEQNEKHPWDLNGMPEWFVNASTISVQDHIAVMCAVQRWVDNSISKTVNLPHEATVDDVRETYEMMYKLGGKGGTVYRDRCRDQQVLHNEPAPAPVVEATPTPTNGKRKPAFEPHPRRREATVLTQESHLGETHVTMTRNEQGEPLEIWLTHGMSGSDLQGMMEAMGKLMSMLVRIESPVKKIDRIKNIISKLMGIGGNGSNGKGPRSIPDAVAWALAEEYWPSVLQQEDGSEVEVIQHQSKGLSLDFCPSCKCQGLARQGGRCAACTLCGHSTC